MLAHAGPELHRRVLRGHVGPDHHRLDGAQRPRRRCRSRSTCGAAPLHWIGGIGIIVLAVAVLPLLGVGGMQLYKAETPGPGEGREAHAAHHRDRQGAVVHLPRASPSAGIVALRCAGMSWFDAICHCLLGDRARRLLDPRPQHRATSIRRPIEFVLMVLMVIAALNFARHFLALRSLSLETYRTRSGGKAMLARARRSAWRWHRAAAVADAACTRTSARRCAMPRSTSSRMATTTGFVTEDYEKLAGVRAAAGCCS